MPWTVSCDWLRALSTAITKKSSEERTSSCICDHVREVLSLRMNYSNAPGSSFWTWFCSEPFREGFAPTTASHLITY